MNLSEYLAEKDLTDAEFAKMVDSNQSTINRIKRGKTFPGRDLIKKINEVSNGEVPILAWFE